MKSIQMRKLKKKKQQIRNQRMIAQKSLQCKKKSLENNYLNKSLRQNLQGRLKQINKTAKKRRLAAFKNKMAGEESNKDDCIFQETNQEIIIIDEEEEIDIPNNPNVLTADEISQQTVNSNIIAENIPDLERTELCLPIKCATSSYSGLDFIPLEQHTDSNDLFGTDYINTAAVKRKLETDISYETIASEDKFSLLEDNNTDDDTIICLDDETTIKNPKPLQQTTVIPDVEFLDDSIIFVSETVGLKKHNNSPGLDFIPLSCSSFSETIKKKISNGKNLRNTVKCIPNLNLLNTPKTVRSARNIFTASETKKMQIYNTNAYNPDKCNGIPLKTGKRMVLIDGSNVAFQHSLKKNFSVKGLEICLKYFEEMEFDVKAIVPQFRLKKFKSTNPEKLEELHSQGKIVFTPCKNLPGMSSTSYDDRFILQLACELDAAIVSNDNYRDLINENPAFKKIIERQVTGYTWCNDIFILPKDPYGRLGPSLSAVLYRN